MFHWLHGFCISKHSYEPPFYALLCSSMPAHNPFNSTSIYSIICNNCYVWLFNPTNLSAPLYTVKPYINGTFLVKKSVIVHDRNYIEKKNNWRHIWQFRNKVVNWTKETINWFRSYVSLVIQPKNVSVLDVYLLSKQFRNVTGYWSLACSLNS